MPDRIAIVTEGSDRDGNPRVFVDLDGLKRDINDMLIDGLRLHLGTIDFTPRPDRRTAQAMHDLGFRYIGSRLYGSAREPPARCHTWVFPE